jgi:hypothetical protein
MAGNGWLPTHSKSDFPRRIDNPVLSWMHFNVFRNQPGNDGHVCAGIHDDSRRCCHWHIRARAPRLCCDFRVVWFSVLEWIRRPSKRLERFLEPIPSAISSCFSLADRSSIALMLFRAYCCRCLPRVLFKGEKQDQIHLIQHAQYNMATTRAVDNRFSDI